MNVRRVFPLVVFGAFLLFSCSSNTPRDVDFRISGAIPLAFEYQGVRYDGNNKESVTSADFGPLFGYFVNARDLDYWRSYDNDDSLNYVVDDSNRIKRKVYPDESLIDRYELFYINQSENLALFIVPDCLVYIPVEA